MPPPDLASHPTLIPQSPVSAAEVLLWSSTPLFNLPRKLGVSQLPRARTYRSAGGSLSGQLSVQLEEAQPVHGAGTAPAPGRRGSARLGTKDEEAVKTLA